MENLLQGIEHKKPDYFVEIEKTGKNISISKKKNKILQFFLLAQPTIYS